MSFVANDIDTEMKTLRITNKEQHAVTHTLKEPLIKKAEEYSCMAKSFYTDSVPPLFHDDRILMVIAPKGDDATVIPYFTFADPDIQNTLFDTARLTTTPETKLATSITSIFIQREHFHNILSLVEYISDQFKDFNERIALYGSAHGAANHIPELNLGANALIHNSVDPDLHCAFCINSSGRAQFTFSDAFLSQFYVAIHPDFAKRIGIDGFLWGGNSGVPFNAQRMTPDYQLFEFDHFLDEVNFAFDQTFDSNTPNNQVTFLSKHSVFLADERSSMIVELTLPMSRKIRSDDGGYSERYTLCEFPIDSYVETESSVRSINGVCLDTIRVKDTLQGGLTDFTRGFPESHVVHFLPGQIRAINTRVFCNYRGWDKKHVDKAFLITGFWDLTLLFTKKVV